MQEGILSQWERIKFVRHISNAQRSSVASFWAFSLVGVIILLNADCCKQGFEGPLAAPFRDNLHRSSILYKRPGFTMNAEVSFESSHFQDFVELRQMVI